MSAEIETIHKPFIAYLDQCAQLCYSYNRPDKPTTSKWPEADFIIYSGTHCLHLEAKDKATLISAGQKKRHAMLAKVGARSLIFRSAAEGIKLVEAWLSMLPASRPIEEPGASQPQYYIGQTAKWGSTVFSRGGAPMRKATIDDLSIYPPR